MNLPETMQPVYFSRHRDTEQITDEDYDNSASMNESNLNQNIKILYNKVCEMVESMNEGVSTNG